MLEAKELALRIRLAMEKPERVRPADLARALGVSPQTVYEWRKTGRIDKRHLPGLARALHRPIEYFLESALPGALMREPENASLRYCLAACFPLLSPEDIASIVGYASGIAAKVEAEVKGEASEKKGNQLNG